MSLSSACVGLIGDGEPEADRVDEPDLGVTCGGESGQAEVAPYRVRRLTHREYSATVRDLFHPLEVPAQSFIADPVVGDFDNGATQLAVDRTLAEQYEQAATEIAKTARDAGVETLTGCVPTTGSDQSCAEEFILRFGERAMRRPLTADQRDRYFGFFSQQLAKLGSESAIELVVRAILQSPEFLYRLELDEAGLHGQVVEADGWQIASRLSYFLWGTMPDDTLFAAVRAGELATVEQIEAHARRMLADERSADSVRDFHRQWLRFDRLFDEEHGFKSTELFPEYDEALAAAIHEEGLRFVERTVLEDEGGLAELLTSTRTYVNPEVATLYGVTLEGEGDDWQPVELDPSERSGILTLAALMAGHADAIKPSPPLRGVFVLGRLLCASPPPPPPEVDTSVEEPAAGEPPKTNREIFEQETESAACASCHTTINGVGFAFEHYDAIGRYRELDHGLPVDASGVLIGTDVDGTFDGARELGERLAQSPQVAACTAGYWLEYALGRPIGGGDACQVDAVAEPLTSGGGVQDLMVAIAKSPSFLLRRVSQ